MASKRKVTTQDAKVKTDSLKRKRTTDWSTVFKDCTHKELKQAREVLDTALEEMRRTEEEKRIKNRVQDYKIVNRDIMEKYRGVSKHLETMHKDFEYHYNCCKLLESDFGPERRSKYSIARTVFVNCVAGHKCGYMEFFSVKELHEAYPGSMYSNFHTPYRQTCVLKASSTNTIRCSGCRVVFHVEAYPERMKSIVK